MKNETLYLTGLAFYLRREIPEMNEVMSALGKSTAEFYLLQARLELTRSEFSDAKVSLMRAREIINSSSLHLGGKFRRRLQADLHFANGRLLYALEQASAAEFQASSLIYAELGLADEQSRADANSLLEFLQPEKMDALAHALKLNEERSPSHLLPRLKLIQARHWMRLFQLRRRYADVIQVYREIEADLLILNVRDRQLNELMFLDALISEGRIIEAEEKICTCEISFVASDIDLRETLEFLKWRADVSKQRTWLTRNWQPNLLVESFQIKGRLFVQLIEGRPLLDFDSEIHDLLQFPSEELKRIGLLLPTPFEISSNELSGNYAPIVEALLRPNRAVWDLKDLAFEIFGSKITGAEDLDLKKNQISVSILRLNRRWPSLIISNCGSWLFNHFAYRFVEHTDLSLSQVPMQTETVEENGEASKLAGSNARLLRELEFGPLQNEKARAKLGLLENDPHRLRNIVYRINKASSRIVTKAGWTKLK